MEPVDWLPLGAEVISRDGIAVGQAKAVAGPYFQVDVPMQPDYWLPMDAIAQVTEKRISLNVEFLELDALASPEPRSA